MLVDDVRQAFATAGPEALDEALGLLEAEYADGATTANRPRGGAVGLDDPDRNDQIRTIAAAAGAAAS